MTTYKLSTEAQQSIVDIADNTEANYGKIQRRKYLISLRNKMRVVASNPENGRVRSDIKKGYYSINVEKHVIYYRVSTEGIEIIDVLHQSMEPRLHI